MAKKKGGARNHNGKKKVGVADGGGSPPSKPSSASASKANNSNNNKPNKGNNNRKRAGGRNNNNKASSDFQLRQMIESDGTKSVIDMAADGNCLFRSLSDQLYHDFGNEHEQVRKEVVDFIEAHKDDFAAFLVLSEDNDDDEDRKEEEDEEDASNFQHYIAKMKESGEWGSQVELVAAGRLYRRTIHVYDLLSLAAYDIQHGSAKPSAGPDLLVSYHDNNHYNSVRDNTKGKPPPPIKTYLKQQDSTWSESNVTGASDDTAIISMECDEANEVEEGKEAMTNESETASDAVVVDTANVRANAQEEEETGDKKPEKRLKKNDTCPCGSGLRYKKCCLARKKHNTRLQRMQGEQQQEREKEEDAISEKERKQQKAGEFRVLTV